MKSIFLKVKHLLVALRLCNLTAKHKTLTGSTDIFLLLVIPKGVEYYTGTTLSDLQKAFNTPSHNIIIGTLCTFDFS